MCYSAQILQSVRKLHRELGLRLDYDEALKLFSQRLEQPGISVARGFEANFDEPANEAERRIKAAIDAHRARAAARLEQELFAQKTRIADAERSLQRKETKKSREVLRIASNKVESLTARLSDLRRAEPQARDNRIFPMMYAGVIIRKDGRNLLTPMRYSCRPAGKPAFYDKKFPGLYNARRDNLTKFWREQFGAHHALIVVESFFENVRLHVMEHRELAPGEPERNVVLQFTPEPPQLLSIACLWSRWTDPHQPDLLGFAAITDEPPADVAAAGHDRCIVSLRPERVAAWLSPQGRSSAELMDLLDDRPAPVFQHVHLQAA
jgi:putative SOS response-associated peptidase YedK